VSAVLAWLNSWHHWWAWLVLWFLFGLLLWSPFIIGGLRRPPEDDDE
jgi:hypothetical protein